MRALVLLSALFAGCPADPEDTVEPDTEVAETDGTEAGTDPGTDTPDPCEDLACDNGECLADGATASCDCDEGWEGALCDVDVDECEASACANDATCTNIDGGFTCECEPGWEGDLCDLNVDDCPSADCGNGTCVDGVDAFTCDCDPGWEGDACDLEIDECAAEPCANAVQCVDQLNAFTCICENSVRLLLSNVTLNNNTVRAHSPIVGTATATHPLDVRSKSAGAGSGIHITGSPIAAADNNNCFDAGNGGTGGSARGGAVYVTPTSDVQLVSGFAQNNVLVAGAGGAGGAGRTCGANTGASGGLGGPGVVEGGAVYATNSATASLNPVSGNTEPQIDLSRE